MTSNSSPVSYISVMMSQPPTSSPLTKSCGMVGQFDSADSSARMRGSGRMSTAANSLPTASRAATVRAEKPHAGRSGVPFMKRITSWSRIASAIASRMGFSVALAHAHSARVSRDSAWIGPPMSGPNTA